MIHFTNEVPGANPTGREWSADFESIGDLLEDPRIREWEDLDPRAPFFRWSRTNFAGGGGKVDAPESTGQLRTSNDGAAVAGSSPAPSTEPATCCLFAEYGKGRAKVTIGYLSGDREAIEKLEVWTPPAIDPGLLAIKAKTKHPKHRTLRIPRGSLVRSTAMPGGIDPNLEDTLAEIRKRHGENSVLGWTVDEANDEYKIKVMTPKPEAEKVDERPRIYVPS